MRNSKTIFARLAMVAASGALLAVPSVASAATMLSGLFGGMKSEMKEIVPIVLLIFAAIGIFFAVWGIISSISAKKNQQPLSWQLYAVIGGATAVVAPLWILATSGSLTNGQGNAASQFDELGVKY